MKNINTKEYWDSRFGDNGNWNEPGQKQTREYAKANVTQMSIPSGFNGTILDFGCAMGDAIPVYKNKFPNAKIYGLDISTNAIKNCKRLYGNIAEFDSGDYSVISPKDIIIASHVMEHITNDKLIVADLIKKCKDLFIFVPFEENPLYHEHVNYYEKDYYDNFEVLEKKTFSVHFSNKMNMKSIIWAFMHGRFQIINNFSKKIIMYHIKGLN